MNKDLANCLSNASQYIVKAGEDSIKKQLINEIIPLKAAKNHKNRTVHIHDFEFYSISYNCIGISVKSLLGNDLYSFPKALRSLGRQIIALTNLQSGGIGYLNNISDEDAIDNLREFFFDLNSFSRKGCEKPYVTFNIGLSTSENGRRFSKLLLKAYSEGDENGNPLIFPNIVFKLKKDINFMKGVI